MNILKIILTSFFTLNLCFAVAHHIPQDELDYGPNIPSIGSSHFDKIFSAINSKGESVYDLPYPFENLLKKFEGKNNSFTHTLLPFSRSLQRPLGHAYDPLLNPRLVITPAKNETDISKNKIFIGYVKQTDQMEVISYNDEAGRFEYQLVANYSKKPKVYYVERGKCLSCHQGQSPIFSIPNWSDTTFGVMSNLVAAKLAIKETNADKRRALITKKLYGDIPSLDDAFNFDFAVRASDRLVFQERVWNVGCGQSNECRLGLLLQTLVPNSNSAQEYYEISKDVILKSKLKDQKIYHGFLTSSDIGASRVIAKYATTGPGDKFDNTANNENAILELIDNIYKLEDVDNPTTIRMSPITDQVIVPRMLNTFEKKDLTILKRNNVDIEQKVLSLFSQKNELFGQGAINKTKFMAELLGEDKNNVYSAWIKQKTPPKELFEGAIMPVFKERELNVLAKNCYKCHATSLRFPLQFLVGDENEVSQMITLHKDKLIFKIKNNLMPPTPAERELFIKSGERQEILDYLNNL